MKLCIPDCIKKILKNFDIFGAQLKFKLDGEDEFRSVTVGISYFIFLVFTFWFFITQFIPFINRERVNLIFSNKIVSEPLINLTKTNFNFAVGLLYTSNYTDARPYLNKYLDIKFDFLKLISDEKPIY